MCGTFSQSAGLTLYVLRKASLTIRILPHRFTPMITFRYLARFTDIGSNCYELQMGDTRVVLDAGTHPKHTGPSTLPRIDDMEPNSADGIIVTHPHLDHIGGLPCVAKHHSEAPIVTTAPTKNCGLALLHNSVNVMKSQRIELKEEAYPLFTHKEVERLASRFQVREPGQPFTFGDDDRVEGKFFNAGHVLGAAGVKLTLGDHTVFYTGDIHFEDQTVTQGADFPTEGIDTLIVETTRGAAPRAPGYTREKEKQRLCQHIFDTLDRDGAVLIPVFAFGKTQELLLMLKEMMEEGDLPNTPIHIGGLSTKMTEIADSFSNRIGRMHYGTKILKDFDQVRVLPRGKAAPKFRAGQIYAMSSGMMSEHTASHRIAKGALGNEKNSILFVGYADPESPAGHILEAGKGGKVKLSSTNDDETAIRCDIERFDFSGHAPREQIVDYIERVSPKRVILVHGDTPAKEWFEQELTQKLPECEVIHPEPGAEFRWE